MGLGLLGLKRAFGVQAFRFVDMDVGGSSRKFQNYQKLLRKVSELPDGILADSSSNLKKFWKTGGLKGSSFETRYPVEASCMISKVLPRCLLHRGRASMLTFIRGVRFRVEVLMFSKGIRIFKAGTV